MKPSSMAREFAEASANETRAYLLYRGIKSLLRCDEAEVVQGIARYVMSQHGSLRRGARLMERTKGTPLPASMAMLGGLNRFLEVHEGERMDGAVWIARLSNERRAIEKLPQLLPELGWTRWTFRRRPASSALSALSSSLRGWRRIFGIVKRLHRRIEFFRALRVAELIGYYTRYLNLFRSGRFSLAVMSSHSNPHGIAFNLAARRCGVPVVLITHGMPIRPVARLSYDLALVHCEAARQTYMEEGCRIDRVFLHGRRQEYSPMLAGEGTLPERMSVGIFLCKDVNEERLRSIVSRLQKDSRVSQILIRPHPKNLWLGLDAWIASLDDERVRRTTGDSVFHDLKASDIVLGGNSSVLVDAVTAGRPSGYVPGLDYGSRDLHSFVARGLIYPVDDEFSFDAEAIVRFYQRPDWSNALKLFANVDEDETSVLARVAASMRDLAMAKVAAG
ncbi:MAG TPA: hypothetical protein VF779_19995 [Pyrinomonadaceae bacterium]